ncbi:MAG: hypothetical protein WA057_01495 [Candidatus Magasanikiibacteriota bacterium]
MTTWREILERNDVVGGYLEMREGSFVYCGPIIKVEIEGGVLKFTLGWKAVTDDGEHWRKVPGDDITTTVEHGPMVEANRVKFYRPYFGETVIHLVGGTKLDPAKVDGLQQV